MTLASDRGPAPRSVHGRRRALRAGLAAGQQVVGTFLKLPTTDVAEMAARAGYDFVVVDLEHSALSEADAIGLVRHADVCGLAALVRVPHVDGALIGRLLENGAAGIQLSMLQTRAQARDLIAAVRFAPAGNRSVSLANRAAGFGAAPLAGFLAAEAQDPPLLAGQIESWSSEPLADLAAGLDVVFAGTTDLSVSLGLPSAAELARAVDAIAAEATAAALPFGGWAATRAAAAGLGLAEAGYLVVASDLQILAAGLRAARFPEEDH